MRVRVLLCDLVFAILHWTVAFPTQFSIFPVQVHYHEKECICQISTTTCFKIVQKCLVKYK